MTIFTVFFAVLVANFEFAAFVSQNKNTWLGNGPYFKILTDKEPIRAQGFA